MKGRFWKSLFSLSQYFATFSSGIKEFFLFGAVIVTIVRKKTSNHFYLTVLINFTSSAQLNYVFTKNKNQTFWRTPGIAREEQPYCEELNPRVRHGTYIAIINLKYLELKDGGKMKRRDFLGKTGCGFAGLVASPMMFSMGYAGGQEKRRKYKIDIEIYEAREDTWCHKKGDKFEYPKDIGKICPWLLASMQDFIRLLEHGVTLPWKYEDTPYEKVIDPDGVTTEYVRCPDPTANLVAKITRTAKT